MKTPITAVALALAALVSSAFADDAITVRFHVEATELRLRRLALDVDPGWVPFLGLAVRYHYRDTAIG